MGCIAVIPARGGSRRITRKNIKLFHGKPIIAYSIEAAHKSGLFGNGVFVSTDDLEIAATAKRYGAWALMRSPEMSRDEVGTQAVTIDAIELVRQRFPDHAEPEIVCCLYATSPMLSVHDLQTGFGYMQTDCSHVISVAYPPLRDAAQFYFSRVYALRQNIDYFGADTVLVKIPESRVCDINTPEDWTRAEQMFTALQEKK